MAQSMETNMLKSILLQQLFEVLGDIIRIKGFAVWSFKNIVVFNVVRSANFAFLIFAVLEPTE